MAATLTAAASVRRTLFRAYFRAATGFETADTMVFRS